MPVRTELVVAASFVLTAVQTWAGIPLWAKFFFQLVFAGTAATIVSGAVAERIKFHSFLVFSFVLTAVQTWAVASQVPRVNPNAGEPAGVTEVTVAVTRPAAVAVKL